MVSRNLIDSKNWNKWRVKRNKFLSVNPRCRFCWEDHKLIIRAEVVDHIIPHKGNIDLLLDPTNYQALCKKCHDSKKQRAERRGYSDAVDADGNYTDPNHPVNRAVKFDVR